MRRKGQELFSVGLIILLAIEEVTDTHPALMGVRLRILVVLTGAIVRILKALDSLRLLFGAEMRVIGVQAGAGLLMTKGTVKNGVVGTTEIGVDNDGKVGVAVGHGMSSVGRKVF